MYLNWKYTRKHHISHLRAATCRGLQKARRARARLWAGRAAGLKLGPARPVGQARRPARLKKKTKKIKSIKKNIHFKILFIECIITFKNVGKFYITTK